MEVQDTNLYSVIKEQESEIGEYSVYLVLKDSVNYKWVDDFGAVATITWKILPKENPSTVPMLVIIFSCVVIVLIAVVVTLHSTSVIKKRRTSKKTKISTNENAEKQTTEVEQEKAIEKNKTNKTVTASTRIIKRKPKTATEKTVKKPKEKPAKKEKTVKTKNKKTTAKEAKK